jgi:hypothetical protein
MQRIAIYGLPRMGTTVIQAALCKHFGLFNLDEIYDWPPWDYDPPQPKVRWIREHKAWCAKFLTTNVPDVVAYLKACDPQCVIVMSRANLADAFCSFNLVDHVGGWFHTKSVEWQKLPKIMIPQQNVKSWIHSMLRVYRYDVWQINNLAIEKYNVSLEQINAGCEIEIAKHKFVVTKDTIETVQSGIDWSKLVLNYTEISDMIHEANLQHPPLL